MNLFQFLTFRTFSFTHTFLLPNPKPFSEKVFCSHKIKELGEEKNILGHGTQQKFPGFSFCSGEAWELPSPLERDACIPNGIRDDSPENLFLPILLSSVLGRRPHGTSQASWLTEDFFSLISVKCDFSLIHVHKSQTFAKQVKYQV